MKPSSAKETQHVARHPLNIVLSPDDNESSNLVADEDVIADRQRVLHAI